MKKWEHSREKIAHVFFSVYVVIKDKEHNGFSEMKLLGYVYFPNKIFTHFFIKENKWI